MWLTLQWGQMRNKDNHPPITETNYKIENVSDRNIKRHYQEQTQTVHKQDTTDIGLSRYRQPCI